MSPFRLAAVCGGLCLVGAAWLSAEETEKKPAVKKQEVDITKKFREYNSDKYLRPPTKFNKGHVTPKKLDQGAFRRYKGGFTVQFPSGAPIPTPTVYKDAVYVSGGFHSKEFYCVKADTGELLWGVNLDDDGPSSAVCEDDVCVFNTESCTVFAVHAKTGKLLWSHWLGDPLMSTPAIANGRVFTSYPAGGGGAGGYGQGGGGYGQGGGGYGQGGGGYYGSAGGYGQGAGGYGQGAGGAYNANPSQQTITPQVNDVPVPQANNAPPQNQAPKKPVEKKAKEKKDKEKKDKEKKAKEKKDAKKAPPATHILACLDLKTGKILWQRWIDSDVMSAPVANGEELYATTFSGTVYKFRQKDGEILSVKKSRATSAPVIVDKDVYFTRRIDQEKDKTPTEAIAKVSRSSGKKQYHANPRKAIYLDSRVQQGAQLALKGQALDASNGFGAGAPAAANPGAGLGNVGQGGVWTCQSFQGSRILNSGAWNYNCQGDELFCTNAESGKQRWSLKLKGDLKKVGGALAAPPILAGGRLFVATLDGKILQLQPESGKTEKTYEVGGALRTQPVLVGGKLYVGTAEGKLICIDTGNKKFTGWSAWGGNAAHTGVAEGK